MQPFKLLKVFAASLGASALVATTLAPTALAIPSSQPGHSTHIQLATENNSSSHASEAHEMVTTKMANLKLRVAQGKDKIKKRLEAGQLKACQAHQSAIQRHTANSTRTADTIMNKFADIASKAQDFKTKKGIGVADYDALLADVAAKKAAVEAKIAAAQTTAQDFTCTSDGPKAQLQTFVATMDDVRSALKDYRTSIRNLIQGIRQANGQNRQATSSATPISTSSATTGQEGEE